MWMFFLDPGAIGYLSLVASASSPRQPYIKAATNPALLKKSRQTFSTCASPPKLGCTPQDANYPSAVTLSLIYRDATVTEAARKFIDVIHTAKGQDIVRELGGIPIKRATRMPGKVAEPKHRTVNLHPWLMAAAKDTNERNKGTTSRLRR